MPGMTTSVTSRSSGSLELSAQARASAGLPAARTVYPLASSSSAISPRTPGSSSTSRIPPRRVRRRRRRRRGGHLGLRLVHARQIDLEGGAPALLAGDPDEAAALLDDAVHRGEAEPRPHPGFLVVKKGSNTALGLGVHASPVSLTDSITNGPAGRGLARRKRSSSSASASSIASLPPGHRVARVHREVQEDLHDLVGVRAHAPEVLRRHDGQGDVLADDPLEHVPGLADDVVQVQHPGLQHLLAGEREELPGEGRGALGRPENLLDPLRPGDSFPTSARSSSPWPSITLRRLLKSWATPPARPPHRAAPPRRTQRACRAVAQPSSTAC